MTNRLKGKVAMVTGSARGIGRAIAEAFVQEGAEIAIIDHDEVQGETTAEYLRQMGGYSASFVADISDEAAVKHAVDAALAEFARFDILVNNAGISQRVPFVKMTVADWDRLVNVNLRGVFLVTRQIVPHMLQAGQGRIINVASQMGQRGASELVHYSASKAGVLGFTKALARELAPHITVNAIAPGPILTDMTQGREPRWYENIEAELPLARLGRPEEVAPTAVFLASDDGALYTGQTLGPNCGHVML